MKAFREERKTMHTTRVVRWVSSVAVLTATALGLGAPLAAPASAAAETITASASQNVGTAGNPVYVYATGNTATINVTDVGATTTPAIKGIVTSGPDSGTQIACTQAGPTSWTCQYANGGTAGADAVTIFDDNSPVGTTGQPDSDEAQTTLTVNFEKLTASVSPPRTQSAPNAPANISVTVSGKPAGWTPQIEELLLSGTHSSAGACTDNNPGPATSWTCTVINDGRTDAVSVKVFDDFTGNNSPDATEPSATANVYFEQVTATVDQTGTHSAGATVTISATADGVPSGQSPNFDYQVVSGPDIGGVHTCSSATPASCSLTNNGTTGTDTVRVFDDTNNNGQWDSTGGSNPAEPSVLLPVAFGDSVAATPEGVNFPTKDANNPDGGVAPVDVTVTTSAGETPAVYYYVSSGPDVDNPSDGSSASGTHPCSQVNGSLTNWVCNVKNTSAQPGTDTVHVFNDLTPNPPNGKRDAGDPVAPTAVTVTFVVPASTTLTPTLAPNQAQNNVAVNGCRIYTVTVPPAVKFPVVVTAQMGRGTASSAPAPVLSTCNVPGGSTITTSDGMTSTPGSFPILTQPTWTETLAVRGSTNQDPTGHPAQLVFGLASSAAGNVVLHATTTLAANNQGSSNVAESVVAPGAPHTLTATPASTTIAQGGNVAFKVLVQDTNGTPIPNAPVSYVVNAGGPDATTKAVSCAAADSFGNAACALTNNRNIGVDHVTFFAPQTTGETAPAASDPQTTATVNVTALPPAGSSLTFGCPDELTTDTNHIVPSCTVSTLGGSQRQVIFAAHVADPGGAPLANIPVTFTLGSAPSGSTETASQVSTNAKGNALYIVTVPSPAAGNKITVQAQVGDPANGGLGPKSATATFQAPHPALVTVTPSSQRIGTGGAVSLTGHVFDQFGVGVSGQTLSWAVSGRNSRSGSVTTGSSGAGTFSYFDTGTSGSDSVSALDTSPNAPSGAGSNNPASATVTYSSSGCTSNCGGGTGQKETPTLKVTQSLARHGGEKLKLIVTSHPRLVQAIVVFYQVKKDGTRHKIGQGRTGSRGKVTGTLTAAHGLHLRFQAKVKGKAGVRGGFTPVVKVHVR